MKEIILSKKLLYINQELKQLDQDNQKLLDEIQSFNRTNLYGAEIEYQSLLAKVKENDIRIIELVKDGKKLLDEYENIVDSLVLVEFNQKIYPLLRNIELFRMQKQGYMKSR